MTKEIRVTPSPEIGSKNEEKYVGIKNENENEAVVSVPPYSQRLFHMMNGSWLNLNAKNEKDAYELFINSNINLSVISALLFVAFLPLYLTEPNRVSDPNDGLTIDITNGYLSPIVLSMDSVHDLFDVCYFVAMSSSMIGTVISITYLLAGVNCENDQKTFVLLKTLGIFSEAPFYYLNLSFLAWGVLIAFHVCVVARTAIGFYLKIFFFALVTFGLVGIVQPRVVEGLFLAKREEQLNSPVVLSEDEIKQALDRFFADVSASKDFSFTEFLKTLTRKTKAGFRPQLQLFSELKALKLYYAKVAEISSCSEEEVIKALELRSK